MNPNRLWMLGSLTLVLTACPATPAPAPQPVTGVSGTVVVASTSSPNLTTAPWTGGAGTVSGQVSGANTTSDPLVVTTSMGADGTFTLPLPADLAAGTLRPFNSGFVNAKAIYDSLTAEQATCTGTPSFSTESAAGSSIALSVAGSGQVNGRIESTTRTGTSSPATGGTPARETTLLKSGMLLYMDRPLTVRGTVTCSGPLLLTDAPAALGTVQGKTTFNLNLVKGWNKVTTILDQTAVSNVTDTAFDINITLNVSLASGALPTDNWVFEGTLVTGQHLPLPTIRLF